jgi:hypothetical protein
MSLKITNCCPNQQANAAVEVNEARVPAVADDLPPVGVRG